MFKGCHQNLTFSSIKPWQEFKKNMPLISNSMVTIWLLWSNQICKDFLDLHGQVEGNLFSPFPNLFIFFLQWLKNVKFPLYTSDYLWPILTKCLYMIVIYSSILNVLSNKILLIYPSIPCFFCPGLSCDSQQGISLLIHYNY